MRNVLSSHSRPQSLWDLISEMDRAFEDRWQSSSILAQNLPTFTPTMDVKETPDYFLVTADLPGLNKNDIKIAFADGRLTLSGERVKEIKSENEHEHRIERSYGRFERVFQLPNNISDEKIQARYEDGVLEIMIPKSQVAKPKTISIDSEKKGLFSKLIGTSKVTSDKSEH